MKRGRPRSASLSADIVICCPNKCAGERDLRSRSCLTCNSKLGFICVSCGRLLSLSNRTKGHKCLTPLSILRTPDASSIGRKLTFLMVLRPRDSLVVVPPRTLSELPNELVREHVTVSSIGEHQAEDYTMLMFQLHLMGHAVHFVSRAEWTRMLCASDLSEWRTKLNEIDVVVDGRWPYECTAEHTKIRHLLDELGALMPALRLLPSPADTLFTAHKVRSHAHLEQAMEKPHLIPSVYLSTGCSVGAVAEALTELTKAHDTQLGVVLKRGLASGPSNEAYHFASQAPSDLARQIHGALHSAAASGVPPLWLLQPRFAEHTEAPVLQLYFDFTGHLVHALVAQKRNNSNADSEIHELRRDDTARWAEYHVDEATVVALEVRKAILRVAPSLAPLLRLDLIRTKEWGFVVKEVEHFGDTWLQLQRTTSAEVLPRIAASVEHWARLVRSRHTSEIPPV